MCQEYLAEDAVILKVDRYFFNHTKGLHEYV